MFRFTIRDLLWLTVVVALGVGWWMDRSGNYAAEAIRWARRANAAKSAATGEGWTIRWDGDSIDMSRPDRKPYILRYEPTNPAAPAPNPPRD
ncbi:MAG TPA: hypothetical protein VMP01_29205 [Pirellulaceae bacterium]|nr:hypothetical protein [Pirellulaceae bacterium]